MTDKLTAARNYLYRYRLEGGKPWSLVLQSHNYAPLRRFSTIVLASKYKSAQSIPYSVKLEGTGHAMVTVCFQNSHISTRTATPHAGT